MKLAKRVSLHYQAGNSDKVYEVDLCQIAEDKYLVNFRYGRRGKNLKEGSKTVKAVSLVEAEKIFNKLIADKKKKGYRDVDNLESVIAVAKQVRRTQLAEGIASNTNSISDLVITPQDPRHFAIIDRLAKRNEDKWPLDRVIWRAGELKIENSVPLLLQLIGTGEPLRDYCIAWALGRCGARRAIPALQTLADSTTHPEHIRRIAWEALYQLSNDQERSQMRSQKITQLPLFLRNWAESGSREEFEAALQVYLDNKDYKRYRVFDTLYQINNQYVRPAILDLVKTAPFQPNYFKQLRHIFKMAEYRGDGEVFGILAYRFEIHLGNFKNYPKWEYSKRQRRYVATKNRYHTEELKKPNSNKAYSEQTREYLRRRVWRTLKTLGEENEASYVNLATETLLQYSDADAERTKFSAYRKYDRQTRNYKTNEIYWDKFASRIILNHLLYENSPRYQSHPIAWRCQGDYKPGNPIPEVREEAFSQLWNEQPSALLRLLLHSKCLPVQEFAVKALTDNQEYCAARLDIPTLVRLLSTTYKITAEFAFNLARNKYNPQLPDRELVLAVANCIINTARECAYQWIEAQREYFFSSSDFIANLVTSDRADTRAFARRLLSSSILNESTAQVLIARIISALLNMDVTQTEMALEVSETLLLSFTPQLRTLGFPVILDLLLHPLPEIQVLGARIILNHQTPATELSPDLIESLLSSPHESVRTVGIRIFGQLPDARLISDRILIVAMAVNSITDIRSTIRPIIERLARNNPEFGRELALDLIDLLTEPERHEGVHKDIATLLHTKISNWMTFVPTETIIALTRAKSSVAQELGGIILQANSNSLWSGFNTNRLVKFANHEIKAIRQAAWQMMELKLDSIRSLETEMIAAVKMLEAKWEDSQEFARSLFDKLNSEDWTPEIMISVCDSTKENVRRFGRDIVTSNFKEEYGQEYLLKFSEHPSADMQMFVTNYLETYAVDDEERLSKLVPYFVTVLSGVNKGRVAKKRIFQFLEEEAVKNKESARIVAQVLTRQSATMAIADKASAIQIMLRIRKQYPRIDMPIRIKEVTEVR